MMNAKKPAGTCSFIGLARDKNSHIDEAWPEHRCYSTGSPSQVTTGTQNLYCLTSGHTSCPRYVLAQNMKAARTTETPDTPSAKTKLVKVAKSDEDGGNRWGELSQWGIRVGLVAAVVTLMVSLDFAFFRSMRTDTVRGESVATQVPQIRTYTLNGATATVVPPQGSSTLTGAGVMPSASPANNQTSQPAIPTVVPTVNTMPALPTVRPANPNVQPMPVSAPEPPKVIMQPGEGPAGTTVMMMGSNWTGSSEVMLRWGTKPSEEGMTEAGTVKTGAAGEFSSGSRVPANASGLIYLGIRQGNQAAYLPFKVTK